MYGRVCEWIYVTRSKMSALILLPGESWRSPLDLSFSPLTSRLATPSRASGCMNVEVARPAAPLAFIALRIHTALTAPCPRKYSWVVAVNVLISFVFSPWPAYLHNNGHCICCWCLFVDVFFLFPPVCRGSILSSLRKGDHVYTGGPAESLKGWWLWCGACLRNRFCVRHWREEEETVL